ncbi:hypothetical protein AMS68_000691 [Peltaster fructicola]|uniref:Pre-mRNA-splicing factor n=1 Tax=Peltaster fructicola TaxID=286661 RepID=A0A6H0XKB7_9PEZI|nr:hypothetical protein AMS68_000691 [Peltaster fructicola]
MQHPTVADLTSESSHFAQLARKTWLLADGREAKASANIIKNELYDKLEAEHFDQAQVVLLEQLQCLERFLWPGYSDTASDQHVVLIILLVNAKLRAKLPPWNIFLNHPEHFPHFIRNVLRLIIDPALPVKVKLHLLCFLNGAFQSLDVAIIRKECAPLVSISIWHNLHSPALLELKLAQSPHAQKAWKSSNRRYENADEDMKNQLQLERGWLYTLILDLLKRMYDTGTNVDGRQENVRYSERVLELLCDLESQLPTRRYTNSLLEDLNVASAIRSSPLYADEESKLLRELALLLDHYITFPLDDQTGQQWSAKEHDERQNARISRFQKAALKTQPEKLKMLYLANAGSLAQKDELQGQLDALSDAELVRLCTQVHIRTTYPDGVGVVVDRAMLYELVWSFVERRPYFVDVVRDMSTAPTETHLYDSSIINSEAYDQSRPLALPKLNLQFLSSGDFLWRSFILSRCEAFYEIKAHLEDTLKRIQPKNQTSGRVVFDGFSRMAIPINKPAIVNVEAARVGEGVPAEVKAEVVLDVSRLQPGLRREWEQLKPGDVIFLVAVTPQQRSTNGIASHITDSEKAGLKAIRCAEVITVLDDNGRPLRRQGNPSDDEYHEPQQRRLMLKLDPIAYKMDQDRKKADIYESINLVVRRRGRENNFKAVLDSIKSLLLSSATVPKWLQDVFLGFGDPSSASYKRLPNRLTSVDFRDTFVDWQHLIEGLPGKVIEPDPSVDASFGPPYVLEASTTVEPVARPTKKRKREANIAAETSMPIVKSIKVSTYRQPSQGPYLEDAPKINTVRFTSTQIEAITSGTQPGLTMIVGPPGTGKTDVATQIISNIYHDFPAERTLLVAHSNQALNQLFAKITALDIDARHLLRLGHGEEELSTDVSFSKAGRVESFLEQGGHYLAEVQRLASSIAAPGAHGNSCETAAYFHEVYITPLWKRYWAAVDATDSSEELASAFPFHSYFSTAPQPLFPNGGDRSALLEIARGCERHINKIFDELADIRPFEILRSQRDKSNYLLTKEARIIAMTATHAAIRRQEIASLGFKYDNIIVEEAAQITEIENFLPMTLQMLESGTHNLKRVILVGDHLQNSPIIQNSALRSYANLEQSLFLRLVRLGAPYTMLNAQGRARPSLASLYRWRYPSLTNLPITSAAPEFVTANAGLRYDYQFIDIPDYKGKGESEPTPHFIQNLGEAEYAVALFQYLRLLGYPADRITILTAYAGQRALIRDVLSHRCKNNRLFGTPKWLGTVDKYQGEQNDYVILSLVRTKGPGYLRDLRRLTVALSRARLGLYVLGRREVFESSLELRDAFEVLLQRSNKLEVVTGEMWPAQRAVDAEVESVTMDGVEHLGQYVFEMTQAKVKALQGGQGMLPPAAPQQDEAEDDADDADELEHETVPGL